MKKLTLLFLIVLVCFAAQTDDKKDAKKDEVKNVDVKKTDEVKKDAAKVDDKAKAKDDNGAKDTKKDAPLAGVFAPKDGEVDPADPQHKSLGLLFGLIRGLFGGGHKHEARGGCYRGGRFHNYNGGWYKCWPEWHE